LLLERSGHGWYSGRDTLAVMQAALLLDEVAMPVAPATSTDPEIATVLLNGIAIEEVQLGAEPVSIDLRGLPVLGSNTLTVQVEDESTVYASAALTFMVEEDFSEPVAEGLRVERSFELLSPVWVEAE